MSDLGELPAGKCFAAPFLVRIDNAAVQIDAPIVTALRDDGEQLRLSCRFDRYTKQHQVAVDTDQPFFQPGRAYLVRLTAGNAGGIDFAPLTICSFTLSLR